jgi:hypothetical protein
LLKTQFATEVEQSPCKGLIKENGDSFTFITLKRHGSRHFETYFRNYLPFSAQFFKPKWALFPLFSLQSLFGENSAQIREYFYTLCNKVHRDATSYIGVLLKTC